MKFFKQIHQQYLFLIGIVLFGMGKFAMASQHLRSSVIENKSYLTAGSPTQCLHKLVFNKILLSIFQS